MNFQQKSYPKLNKEEVDQRIKRIEYEIAQCLSFDLPIDHLENELKELQSVFYVRQNLNRKKRLV